ncbi:MAG: DUF1048 domain-containing protein [Sarcina sp.]
MDIKAIMKEKKEWKVYKERVKSLPRDYQIVYEEIQKYLYKVGYGEMNETEILIGIIDFFEEGAMLGKKVLEVTGDDVATFCDELINSNAN